MANIFFQRDLRIEGLVAYHALTAGDLVYLRSDGTWAKAQADAQNKHAVCIATRTITTADVSAGGDRAKFTGALEGIIDGFSGLTPGAMAYLSPSTAGAITTTIPASAGQVVQGVGYALDANRVLVKLGAAARPLSLQSAGNSNANLS